MKERDIIANPYSPDEQRVVDWLIKKTNGAIGAGSDPIGFLMASYDFIIIQRNEYQKALSAIADMNIDTKAREIAQEALEI